MYEVNLHKLPSSLSVFIMFCVFYFVPTNSSKYVDYTRSSQSVMCSIFFLFNAIYELDTGEFHRTSVQHCRRPVVIFILVSTFVDSFLPFSKLRMYWRPADVAVPL
jgi:hypothetical protein